MGNLDKLREILNNTYKLKTKSGKIKKKNITKTDNILQELEKNNNHSWYHELYNRNKDNLDDIALIYRGNEITYGEMFDKIKEYAKSMKKMGLNANSEIPVCMSNCPEIIYILGAASMIGASVNIFGSTFPEDYVLEIINGCNSNVAFIEDRAYEKIKNAIGNSKLDKVVMTSLRDSLKDNMDPNEEKDKFENRVNEFKNNCDKIMNQQEFINYGNDYSGELEEKINMDKDFVITYTSGSTNEKKPKAIVHSSRCYITVARYHDKDLNGGFVLKPYTFLSLIPTYSNSNILSIVSDSLMQGAKLALEPNYSQDAFLDSLVMHNPHYVAATKSFWVDISKKILTNPKYKDIKLRNLFLAFSCGETFEINEEKLVNKMLKKVKAGTNVTHTPFSIVRISEAGGDCEHGSIFYTLFRSYSNNLPTNKKRNEPAGMGTFDFVEFAILDENGNRLGKNSFGRIVANSPCTMKRYKGNKEATNKFFIKDADGKEWADLNVYGYIDDNNKLHMKGRISKDESLIPTFVIAKQILKDTKNILSCEVVFNKENNSYIAHVEFQPNTHKSSEYIITSANRRCEKLMSLLGTDIYFRIRSNKESFPLTGSGKRAVKRLKEEGLTKDCVKPIIVNDKIILKNYESQKEKVKKKIL